MIAAALGVRPEILTWCVVGAATAGVIVRPFRWPEAVWAVAGAGLLVALGLLGPDAAWTGIGRGLDVYLFLIGMMLLSEVARTAGLFEWLAAFATAAARGSATRFFLLVYVAGTVVTVFLSNDATAVVLTPAVYAAARAAKVREPLPYLLACAFIANAASFVLPISNPANLVVFGDKLPPLTEWLRLFALPSFAAILATYAALRFTQRRALAAELIASTVERPTLSRAGKVAAAGIALTALLLTAASFGGHDLGLPTLVAGGATAIIVLAVERSSPAAILRDVSWSVLPLVAGLFVLVEALDRTGVIRLLAGALRQVVDAAGATEGAFLAGGLVALVTNLANNLPVGLVAGSTVGQAEMSRTVAGAILIGVDLGPNLSVTGSLATILWLHALRREGVTVTAWQFLKLGLVVTPPALFLSLGTLILLG